MSAWYNAVLVPVLAAWMVSCGGGAGPATPSPSSSPINWGQPVTVSDPPTYTDAGPDARGISPGTFGSSYSRMVHLADGSWLCAYAIYDVGNLGYTHDPNGGTRLQIARSTDEARTWTVLGLISDPGRDLDNPQMIQMDDGGILLAARSVRWGESYRLPVYRSADGGATWSYLSDIDSNQGTPGSLASPPQGLYEPHFLRLGDGRLAVMYSSEKHSIETPAYSQIISERVSPDLGVTWGPEIWVVAEAGGARPGMPVWTRLSGGQYLLVYEVCGTRNCDVYESYSADGVTWPFRIGENVPGERGGPFILALSDGRLLVTSNSGQVSLSTTGGATWQAVSPNPLAATQDQALWSSAYQTGASEVAVMATVGRSEGGGAIQMRFGTLLPSQP